MKKTLIVILALLLILLTLYFTKVKPMLKIATGYSAKCICSNIFISGRDQDDIERIDLSFLPFTATNEVDEITKSVESSIFGLAKQKAVYKGDLGCSLIIGEDDYNISYHDTATKKSIEKPYPYGDLIQDISEETIPENVNLTKLNEAIDDAFDKDGAFTDKKTRAVVVLYKDTLIGERYGQNHDRNTRILGWSMTKSIMNAMIGLLTKDRRINVNQNELFPEWKDDDRKYITLKSLLQMNSGLDWEEVYDSYSDATEMLYLSEDVFEKAKAIPAIYPEGTHWYYSSGTSNILSGYIREKFDSTEEYYDFLHQRLFNKIGMDDAVVEIDEAGNFIGSSYGYATALDWARFGTLYLHKGVWDGELLFEDSWIKFTTLPADGSEGEYGAQFWLNTDSKFYPDVPSDMFSANGFQGQKVIIIPSKDLVIVRLGFNSDFDFNGFISKVIEAIE